VTLKEQNFREAFTDWPKGLWYLETQNISRAIVTTGRRKSNQYRKSKLAFQLRPSDGAEIRKTNTDYDAWVGMA